MLGTMTAVALALSTITPTTPSAAAPPPRTVTVEVVTVNGSGCPAGSAKVAPNQGNTAFTVTYNGFLARAGLGASPVEFRKNCQVNLKFRYPEDMTFGISQVDYSGFARLRTGAVGLHRANHYYAGSSSSSQRNHPFNGPLDGDWRATDTTEAGAVRYPPCGQFWNLNLNTELRVNAGAAGSEISSMSMSPSNGDVSATYHVTWMKCP